MTEAGAVSSSDVYEAVLALSRSIAGRNDLKSLLSGVAESICRIVSFERIAVTLYDANQNGMHAYIMSAPGDVAVARVSLSVDQDPGGWVWLNQEPLLIPSIEAEARWPKFSEGARAAGVSSILLVPLTAGQNRLGAFGFGCASHFKPSPAEIAFLERVSSEFAVAVEAFLAKQEVVRERDRLRTLFDITNALVAKLSADELFAAISQQLYRVIPHDVAALSLCHEEGTGLDLYALHFTGERLFEQLESHVDSTGLPSAEAIATGKAVLMQEVDLERFPSPHYRRFVNLGFKSACSVPLITPNRTIGTLEVARKSSEVWMSDDVDFLVQVARQIAIAIENSLAFRELNEMHERLATEKLYLEDEIRLDHNIGNMVGAGQAFQSVLKSIQIVAPTDATVLVLGETGTGKELVARAIHELSDRSKRSFVKVNCAAIPASLLESELFGHEKGAFTGAVGQKIGRFEVANQGTLFLDEIGEMPIELQSKLLRAIQDQEFERIGGSRTIRTDVRFIAATNRDLKTMVEENKFRADLYFRLHVFPLHVPPLRERREDIPLLARYFVQKYAQRMGRDIESIASISMEALTKHHWPGNIRELHNLIERSVILCVGNTLHVAMHEFTETSTAAALQMRNSNSSAAAEREAILHALRQANGLVGGPNGAAARLGLKRTTLQSRMRKYNIARQYE
jgi:formate hydrogenlyase transcriptional activator